MYKSMASQHLYHNFNVPAELGNLIDPKESFCVAECIMCFGYVSHRSSCWVVFQVVQELKAMCQTSHTTIGSILVVPVAVVHWPCTSFYLLDVYKKEATMSGDRGCEGK